MSIFITSDLHLGHNKNFVYEPRGFSSIEEHDAAIVENINKYVGPNDELYLLGDLVLNDNEQGIAHLKQLQCQHLYLVFGNHETNNRLVDYHQNLSNLGFLGYAVPFVVGKKHFMLSHYPMATTNFDDDKKPWQRVYNLCGHSHQKEKWDAHTDSIHCELDAWDNRPASIDEILQLIRERCGI